MAVTLTAGALVTVAAGQAHATSPGRNGRIVFVSDQAGGRHLFTVRSDGTGLRQVSDGPGDDIEPAFSPDGTQIAFAASATPGGAVHGIYVSAADGSGLRRVTPPNGTDYESPSWSPDQQHLAFTETVAGGGHAIATIGIDGTHLAPVTDGTGDDQDPAYSPDGRRIAFDTNRFGAHRQIAAVTLRDHSLTLLTAVSDGDASGPSWSPSGYQIAFTTNFRGGIDGALVLVVTVRTGAVTVLDTADIQQTKMHASWSPDGTAVVYEYGDTDPLASHPAYSLDEVSVYDQGQRPTVLLSSSTFGYRSPSWGAAPIRCGGRWATISGSSGADYLVGTAGPDVIAGLGGSDRLVGGGGADVICGGDGSDVVSGGAGADRIIGGNGRDRLFGGAGADRLLARDRVRDGTIDCGAGADVASWDHGLDPAPRSC